MDNRRLLFAMLLSLVVLFGWQALSKYMGWAPVPETAPEPQTARESPAPSVSSPPLHAETSAGTSPPAAAAGQDILVETPLYKALFNSAGGIVKEFTLKQYQGTNPQNDRPDGVPLRLLHSGGTSRGILGFMINNQPDWGDGAVWSYDGKNQVQLDKGETTLLFTATKDGLVLQRAFTFTAGTYLVREQLRISGKTAQTLGLTHVLSSNDLAGPAEYVKSTKVILMQKGNFIEEENQKTLAAGQNYGDLVSWAGVMSSYFMAAAIPSDPALNLRAAYQSDRFILLLEKQDISLTPAQDFESEVNYYLGPKRKTDLEAALVDFSPVMEYGWFGWIAAPLLVMLQWFYSFTGNWGAAIILLTVVVKIVLWPLSYKSYKSMENMKKLQPLMQKIREKYKDDRQRQNQEVMQLYKTYKVNPMGGCLPIFVQLPVFFGLYRALLSSIELRQAAFIETLPFTNMVWLADLSIKDPLYVTPLIMGATMLLQQKMTPSTGDPTQAKIMMFMPVIFTFFFINFPSGLVLYWLFSNIISILQQYGQMKLSVRKKD